MRYIPKSIELQGLKGYLNATRSRHNGKDYDDFVFINSLGTQVKLAEEFDVNRDTIRRWMKVYKKEKSKQSNNKDN